MRIASGKRWELNYRPGMEQFQLSIATEGIHFTTIWVSTEDAYAIGAAIERVRAGDRGETPGSDTPG